MTTDLLIKRTEDFEVTGLGDAPVWGKTDWQTLQHVESGPADYRSRVKVLYSATGMYFLYDCQDQVLTATRTRENDDIYLEDVVELFLWTDEAKNLYFEYELSPLNVELTLIVPNHEGTYFGWAPWHYEGERRIRHATGVTGGPAKPLAKIEGWTAEFFVPFALFKGLGNCPPTPGMKWRANMYRIDYDHGHNTQWAWCPDTGGHFHNFRQFGTIVFE
jgi:hypothetical protein